MNDRLWNPAKKLADHGGLELFRDAVESLLDNMTPKGIHTQCNGVSPNGIGNSLDLFLGTMLEAPLNEKVSEPVNHELVGLCNNSIDNSMFLICRTDLELLL